MHVSKSSFIICEAWTMHLTQSEISASGLRTLPQAGFRIGISARCANPKYITPRENNPPTSDIVRGMKTTIARDTQKTFFKMSRFRSTNTNTLTP